MIICSDIKQNCVDASWLCEPRDSTQSYLSGFLPPAVRIRKLSCNRDGAYDHNNGDIDCVSEASEFERGQVQ